MVRRRALPGWCCLALGLVAGEPAAAHVQDYQIVRLIASKSECRLDKLVDRSGRSGPLHYFATCENVTFYPEGLDVTCDDPEDDRTCRVLTAPHRFDNLDLLQRR